MDNLSRTEKDLRPMTLDYLHALKQELEGIGMKQLGQLDRIEEDNKTIQKCLKMLKFVPKHVKEAQKIEREKLKES